MVPGRVYNKRTRRTKPRIAAAWNAFQLAYTFLSISECYQTNFYAKKFEIPIVAYLRRLHECRAILSNSCASTHPATVVLCPAKHNLPYYIITKRENVTPKICPTFPIRGRTPLQWISKSTISTSNRLYDTYKKTHLSLIKSGFKKMRFRWADLLVLWGRKTYSCKKIRLFKTLPIRVDGPN